MSDPIVWPLSFTRPSENFKCEILPSSIRTNMDSGITRQRRRFTTDYAQLSVRWDFSDTEFGIFAAFHQYKLVQGSAWFTINLPLGGDGMQPHIARFVDGKYSHDYVPVGYWAVSATLEVQQINRFSEATLDIYLYLGFTQAEIEGLLRLFDRFHAVVNTDLPDLTNS